MDFSESDPCMICHVPVGAETPDGEVEAWSVLPCGHRFGSYCIKRWLGFADQPACPICRTPMLHVCGHPVLPLPTLPGAGEAEADDQDDGEADDDDDDSHDSHSSHSSHSTDGHSHDGDHTMHKKMAYLSQSTATSSHLSSSPTSTGSADSSPTSSRSLSFLRKHRLGASGASSLPARTAPDTQTPCDYCAMSLLKQQFPDGPPGGIVRFAVRIFTPHIHSSSSGGGGGGGGSISANSQSNWENAYWERWRKDHGAAFGEWWAVQQPPTEPARELPPQGWVL